MSTYIEQATSFLTKTNTTLTVKFLKHDKHFVDDKESRDIYEVTLTRNTRNYTFNFGQSINCSGEYIVAPHLRNKLWCEQTTKGKYAFTKKEFIALPSFSKQNPKDIYLNPNFAVPNAYDILTCLQKYDVGTFENFCDEFGYNNDSIKALKTYEAVSKEYKELQTLFNDTELDEMREIQ